MSRHTWILLAVLSLLWGGSFLMARIAAPVIPPLTLVLLRVGLAAAALAGVLLASRRRFGLTPARARDYLVMGVLNNVVPFGLIFYGTQTIGAGLASIFNATTSIFTVVLMHFATRDDRLTLNRLAGVLLGLVGVSVIMGPSVLLGLGEHLLAEIALLAAPVSYAVSTLWARRFRGQDPMITATGQLSAATLVCLPLALLAEAPWTLDIPSAGVIGAVLFLALASTSLAYVIFFRIMTIAGSNVQLVTILIPVSAVLLGWVMLGERLEPRQWAGMALVLAGLAAIDGRIIRLLRSAR